MSQTITREDRFSALETLNALQSAGSPLAGVVSSARYVDGWPHSYTREAQAWAVRVLVAAAADDLAAVAAESARRPEKFYTFQESRPERIGGEVFRNAIKVQHCETCGGVIPRGTRYARQTFRVGGDLVNTARHLDCPPV